MPPLVTVKPPLQQALSAETRRLNALSAQLARICQPKPKSGKLEVSEEVFEQWKKGGKPRNLLLPATGADSREW